MPKNKAERMGRSGSRRSGDDAKAVTVGRLLRRFEADWNATPGRRPDIAAYLPADGRERSETLLALVRADLSLRWQTHERILVEWYRERFPELWGDDLAALIYEEFCLSEEAGDVPEPAHFLARFPDVADLLGPVFEIHGLLNANILANDTVPLFGRAEPSLPEAGQTIADFRLVEELGRGAFARVFQAVERPDNRTVALKVALSASREPLTLARLQHPHIVPIYSYRTDPVTGLSLLCMPYLGRVTLARILEDPALPFARNGTDLLAVLDRLDPPNLGQEVRSPARALLADRTYDQAIAWWGARLAEALQHAHDRGIWHGDIKPSNVLVTDDGLPMVLDFNLAQEAWLGEAEVPPAVLGGTMAYMAPEQLEALAEGRAEHAEGRTDIFALGVVLFETLVPGERPFSIPIGALTIREVLLEASDERRLGAPPLSTVRPGVPASLVAVVERSLAPWPEDRYASAAELAADLQAVADDEPPHHA